MSITASVQATVTASRRSQSGLTTSITEHPVSFFFDVGDCTLVWSDRRTFSGGFDEVDFAAAGLSTVKLLRS